MECLKVDKHYVIPTIKWLIPISELVSEDINNDGLIILSNLIKKENVLVKITQKKNRRLIYFDKILKNEPNFIHTYCAFSCNENVSSLANKYKDTTSFCNNDTKLTKEITLEIMKRYYNGSLNTLINSLDINKFTDILKQVILSQINVFYKYGIVHNDLHLGNILFETLDKKNKLIYKLKNNEEHKYLTDFKIIISDFGYSVSYDPYVYKNYNTNFMDYSINEPKKCTFDIEFNLIDNIITSIKGCVSLLKNEYFYKINDMLKNYLEKDEYFIEQYYNIRKLLRNYYKKRYDYTTFRDRTLNTTIIIANRIYSLISNDKNELTHDLK